MSIIIIQSLQELYKEKEGEMKETESTHTERLPKSWPHYLRKTTLEIELEAKLESEPMLYAGLENIKNIQELKKAFDKVNHELFEAFFRAQNERRLTWNRWPQDRSYEFSCEDFKFQNPNGQEIQIKIKFCTDADSEGIWSFLKFGGHGPVIPSRDPRVQRLYKQVIGMPIPFIIS